MILYSYFRSSAAYRVRIALNIKNMEYDIKPVHLLNSGGEQHSKDYHQLNPLELVPVLSHNGMNISQSMAIMDYLEHVQPRPSLYPLNIQERVACQEFALSIACEIHPINNLRVLQKLKQDHELSEEQVTQWNLHWIGIGFSALEERVGQIKADETKPFCFGDHPSLADICLIPQVYNGL
ncbi:MAG: maleylacetoacetate isomerase, partial [Bermanella sp.]